jgi:nucleoside-diphosphate-sugar epimerase
MHQTALILGARGRFGLAATKAFADAGWRVVAQTRGNGALPFQHAKEESVRWLPVDLNEVETLVRQAQGAQVVVNALNPAYNITAWREHGLPLMEFSIAVARGLQARLMFPGNVYNFGSGMPELLHEDTPQLADTVMGQVRVDLEMRAEASDVRAVVIRAGNFFGSGRGTVFDQVLVKDVRKGHITYLGVTDIPSAWAYLPDLARTFVAVAERRGDLPKFKRLHFAGHTLTGQDWLNALTLLAKPQHGVKGAEPLKLKQLPWLMVRMGALLVPPWAAMASLRYLWQVGHALDNQELVRLIGAEPHTPLHEAATAALHELGHLDAPA